MTAINFTLNPPDETGFPTVLFTRPDVHLENTEKGVTWKTRLFNGFKVVEIELKKYELQLVWFIFPKGIDHSEPKILVRYNDSFSTKYKWNHIVFRNDRTGPFYSYILKVSRNAWGSTKLNSAGNEIRHPLRQIEPGPVHALFIGKQSAPFGVDSFKEVGIDSPGGVKFRLKKHTWLLYELVENTIESPMHRQIPQYANFMMLHFKNDFLVGLYEITDTAIRFFGED